jgi:tetratricopeptide (TPR) repeat protein
MDNVGYLYVLANSAMPGLVKVGKTTRSPSERSTELSGVTGLPTPFIVVYEQLFRDCSAAEAFVHTHLANQGYRVAENREFFNAPVNDVVRAIAFAPDAINTDVPQQADELLSENTGDELDSLSLNDPSGAALPPWHGVFEEAENFYYGIGDSIQDYVEALRLYRQAARLGCLPAYGKIGGMHKLGEGVREDKAAALEYYKVGARKGSVYCYWAMGRVFMDAANNENAEKCFTLFLKNLPSNIPDEVTLTSHEFFLVGIDAVMLMMRYVIDSVSTPASLIRFVSLHKYHVLKASNRLVELAHNRGDTTQAERYLQVSRYLESLPPTD